MPDVYKRQIIVVRNPELVAEMEAEGMKRLAEMEDKSDVYKRQVIPVFPGTNCEYDSARAFEEAGGEPVICVLRNLTPQALEESLRELAAAIDDAQILMLSGGFSGGDEPDGSGKFIAAVLRSPIVSEAVTRPVSYTHLPTK